MRADPSNDSLDRVVRAYWSRRYTVLFYSLLLTFVAGPLLSVLGLDTRLLEVFVLFNLVVAGTGSVRRGRRWYLSVLLLAGAVGLVAELLAWRSLVDGSLFLVAALVLVATASAFLSAVRADRVDTEHLYGALSAFLLAGLFFGFLGYAIERAAPASYIYMGAPFEPGVFNLPRAIYFSFITLATLGYGDIVPASDLTRGLAVLEAVAGQLYIAVMVARLVSLYGTPRRD